MDQIWEKRYDKAAKKRDEERQRDRARAEREATDRHYDENARRRETRLWILREAPSDDERDDDGEHEGGRLDGENFAQLDHHCDNEGGRPDESDDNDIDGELLDEDDYSMLD